MPKVPARLTSHQTYCTHTHFTHSVQVGICKITSFWPKFYISGINKMLIRSCYNK